MITICSICREEKETKFFPLYVFGSEGIVLCHECEMEVVEFIREKSSENLRKKKQEYMVKRNYKFCITCNRKVKEYHDH